MALSSPPPAPQRGDRATFSQRVDAFLLWLTGIIPQLNSFISSITTLAAGGANSFSYTFDTSTADADPGTGKLRLGSAPQNGAVVMRIDNAAGSGGDISGFLASLAAGTSNVKGSVRLQRVNDVSAWLLFDVTAVATPSGYANLTLTPRAGSSASPFANNDTLMVFFDKQGDRGTSGGTPTSQEIRDAVGTLPIVNGGTGGTTAAVARANLGALGADTGLVKGQPNGSVGTQFLSGGAGPLATLTAGSATVDQVPLIIGNDGNNAASAAIQFKRSGQYIAYFGLDTDNKWKVGGYSMGAAAYEIWHGGNFAPGNYALLSGATFNGPISAPTVTQTSDERKKTNWRPLTDEQLDALAALDLVGVFDWKDGSGSDVGGSAQQIRAIVPEAVHEDAEGNLSVAYGGLVFAMAHGALRRAGVA